MLTATGFMVICVAAVSIWHRQTMSISAQPLRADANWFTALLQLDFQLRALGVVARAAERARRHDLGQVHAQVRRAADADADDGRRAGLAAGVEHAVHDEGLDGVDTVCRDRHLEKELFSEPLPLGIISIASVSPPARSRYDHRHRAPARGVLVLARHRITTDERNGYSRVARSQPLMIACLELVAIDLEPAPMVTL